MNRILSLFAFAMTASLAATASAQADMKSALDQYLQIQDALASDTTQGVSKAAQAIATDKTVAEPIRNSARELAKSSDIASARESFKKLSAPMVEWAKAKKPAGVEIMKCSMANGAWLQKSKEIRNPYYGKSMLRCGEPG